MVIKAFPPHELADEHGVLAAGGDLELQSLLLAYSQGIFPWPYRRDLLLWFSPPQRAILRFSDLHLSRSFKKELRTRVPHLFSVRCNTAFHEVITACSTTPRRRGMGTWLFPEMIAAYTALHEAGFAHSIEVFQGQELVGGIYGVALAGAFAAESMFYRTPNASKVALVQLIELLREQGCHWIDLQVLNSFTETLGACEVSRQEFLRLLAAAHNTAALVFPRGELQGLTVR